MVLLDDAALKADASAWFESLVRRGHTLSYYRLKDGLAMTLKTAGGEWECDNVVILSTQSVSPSERLLTALLDFADAGGNVLLASGAASSRWTHDLLAEFGVTLGKEEVVDRFPPSAGGSVAAPWPAASDVGARRVVGAPPAGAAAAATVQYRGVSVTANAAAVEMGSVAALRAPPTAFLPSAAASAELPLAAGSELALAWAVQSRNNARLVVVGGAHVFLNEAKSTELAARLSEWAFTERGVLRVCRVRHALADGTPPERMLKRPLPENPLPMSTYPDPEWDPDAFVYRVKDDVVFTIEVDEVVPPSESGGLPVNETSPASWRPFDAPDMQFEFVMLDPYERRTMQSKGNGAMQVQFKVPDQYGVFRMRVKYTRPGLSTLLVNAQTSVRPFRHNEYDRFIVAATPYYTAVFAVLAGFFVLSAAIVYQ